jgi:hypothetical protein
MTLCAFTASLFKLQTPKDLSVQLRGSIVQFDAGFFFLAAKYGGRTCGWCICNQSPTTGSPSVFCSQKKEPWFDEHAIVQDTIRKRRALLNYLVA